MAQIVQVHAEQDGDTVFQEVEYLEASLAEASRC